jgi:toxin-antitoxin system PIN domain toxin
MSRALLDVNVVVALLDADHVDHARVRGWLEAEIRHGWASCAITQNGVLRVLSQPRYPSPVPVAQAAARLARATATAHHEFWPCEATLLDERRVDWTRIHGPQQVTDAYLLLLAVTRGGRFVTLDRRIPAEAVSGASPAHLVRL